MARRSHRSPAKRKAKRTSFGLDTTTNGTGEAEATFQSDHPMSTSADVVEQPESGSESSPGARPQSQRLKVAIHTLVDGPVLRDAVVSQLDDASVVAFSETSTSNDHVHKQKESETAGLRLHTPVIRLLQPDTVLQASLLPITERDDKAIQPKNLVVDHRFKQLDGRQRILNNGTPSRRVSEFEVPFVNPAELEPNDRSSDLSRNPQVLGPTTSTPRVLGTVPPGNNQTPSSEQIASRSLAAPSQSPTTKLQSFGAGVEEIERNIHDLHATLPFLSPTEATELREQIFTLELYLAQTKNTIQLGWYQLSASARRLPNACLDVPRRITAESWLSECVRRLQEPDKLDPKNVFVDTSHRFLANVISRNKKWLFDERWLPTENEMVGIFAKNDRRDQAILRDDLDLPLPGINGSMAGSVQDGDRMEGVESTHATSSVKVHQARGPLTLLTPQGNNAVYTQTAQSAHEKDDQQSAGQESDPVIKLPLSKLQALMQSPNPGEYVEKYLGISRDLITTPRTSPMEVGSSAEEQETMHRQEPHDDSGFQETDEPPTQQSIEDPNTNQEDTQDLLYERFGMDDQFSDPEDITGPIASPIQMQHHSPERPASATSSPKRNTAISPQQRSTQTRTPASFSQPIVLIPTPSRSKVSSRSSRRPQTSDTEEDPSQRYYGVRDIVAERYGYYEIEWEPINGRSFKNTWVPKRNANAEAVRSWEEKKKELEKKRGMPRKRKSVGGRSSLGSQKSAGGRSSSSGRKSLGSQKPRSSLGSNGTPARSKKSTPRRRSTGTTEQNSATTSKKTTTTTPKSPAPRARKAAKNATSTENKRKAVEGNDAGLSRKYRRMTDGGVVVPSSQDHRRLTDSGGVVGANIRDTDFLSESEAD